MNSYSRIWLHLTFGTKNRAPFIDSSIEDQVYAYLKDQLQKMECVPLRINGMPDHVHLLFLADYKRSAMDITKQLKGSSSFWINSNHLLNQKFSWQDGFGVFSVSDGLVRRTKAYIDNQKRHHQKLTYLQECERLFKDHSRVIVDYEPEAE